MFYSHEILTSQQHGVATIWLIATVGPRGGTRKVTRKAIESVDVKRACETIIEPGAPLALRLQGSLLYGVSRVYSQQCKYVLSDISKVQQDMMLFCRLYAQGVTDPEAGKAMRDQIILQDDPSWVPQADIPKVHFDIEGDAISSAIGSQLSSRNGFSVLSPMESVNSSGGRGGSLLSYSLSHSDLASLQLPTPLGRKSFKKITLDEIRVEPAQEVNDLDALGEIELDIDADGNIVGIVDPFEEPELPPLPFHDAQARGPAPDIHSEVDERLQQQMQVGEQQLQVADDDGDLIMMDDALLPNEGLAQGGQHLPPAGAAPLAKDPPTKKHKTDYLCADNPTSVNSTTMKLWRDNYLERNLSETSARAAPKTGRAEARVNAFNVVFGQGIAGVGRPNGVGGLEHPLTQMFAGDALMKAVMGITTEASSGSEDGRRRRPASEAFEAKLTPEDARRVRPRLEGETPQQEGGAYEGQQEVDDMAFIFDDDAAPEQARNAPGGLDDRLSSSLMPWNRTPSVHRPSSVFGAKQKLPSPRNNAALPIERYSDVPGAPSSDLGFGVAPSLHSDFEEFGHAAFVNTQEAQESQWMNSTLDRASNEFLEYVNDQVRATGAPIRDHKDDLLWVEFEELAPAGQYPKIVAAQAFLHVLTLATKNLIKVEQRAEGNQPFDTIHIRTLVNNDPEGNNEI